MIFLYYCSNLKRTKNNQVNEKPKEWETLDRENY
jgi:hypothetical protein